MLTDKANLSEKLSKIDEFWSPKIVGELNGQYVKLAKVKGEFIWHRHENEDELFMVIKGCLTLKLKEKDVVLEEGELFVVRRGVDHKPIAEEEAHILMFEPKATLNTGQVRNERTVDQLEEI